MNDKPKIIRTEVLCTPNGITCYDGKIHYNPSADVSKVNQQLQALILEAIQKAGK